MSTKFCSKFCLYSIVLSFSFWIGVISFLSWIGVVSPAISGSVHLGSIVYSWLSTIEMESSSKSDVLSASDNEVSLFTLCNPDYSFYKETSVILPTKLFLIWIFIIFLYLSVAFSIMVSYRSNIGWSLLYSILN